MGTEDLIQTGIHMLNRTNEEPKYGTKLSPKEEAVYQSWKSKLPKPLQDEADNDLRMLWKSNPNIKHRAKDTNIEKKGFVPGGSDVISNESSKTPSSVDKPVVDWWSQYVSSPKYRERLAGFYKYPELVQKQRENVLNNISYRENPGKSSRYYSHGNEVAMSDLQVKGLNTTRPEILSHEIGHALNANRNVKGASLSPAEEDFILKRNKQFSPASYERYRAMSKQEGKSISSLMSGEEHDVDPAENLSDIQSLRYLLKQRKIHDAGEENMTPGAIRKAGADPVIRKSFIWKRLKESFGEKELIDIMNKVASKNNNSKTNLA